MSDAYRNGEEALRSQLEDLAWQRDALIDKRLEAAREIARVQREISEVEKHLGMRGRSERRRWLWVSFLAIPAFAAAGLGLTLVLFFPGYPGSKLRSAKLGAEAVGQAAELFVNTEDATGCPTVEHLVAAKKLDAKKVEDPWGRPYHIACTEDGLHATSAGKDGRFLTPDDIRNDFGASDMKRAAELND